MNKTVEGLCVHHGKILKGKKGLEEENFEVIDMK